MCGIIFLLVKLQVNSCRQQCKAIPSQLHSIPAQRLLHTDRRLSPPVKEALRKKGITALFDIQAQTLVHSLDGFDVVGRARWISKCPKRTNAYLYLPMNRDSCLRMIQLLLVTA